MIKRFFADETGPELSEYAVAAALVVAGVVIAFTTLGNAITTRLGSLSNTITG
jgi:Flp pilus assembly pilin Flp